MIKHLKFIRNLLVTGKNRILNEFEGVVMLSSAAASGRRRAVGLCRER